MKKKILTIAAAAVMTMAMSMTVFAGVTLDGTRGNWIQNDTGWWWQNEDGTWAHTGWYWLDGNEDGVAECYFFDGNGYMLSNAVSADGFAVNADGAWVDENGVVQTRSTTAQPTQNNQTVNTDIAQNSDNGGYNEYGCSNAALEMLHNTKEQNTKFGEVRVIDNVSSIAIEYANGFIVSYPGEGSGMYRTVSVNSYVRPDLDGTYLFKYYNPDLNADEAADYLRSIGFSEGINDGVFVIGTMCGVNVGYRADINWNSNGGIVLR